MEEARQFDGGGWQTGPRRLRDCAGGARGGEGGVGRAGSAAQMQVQDVMMMMMRAARDSVAGAEICKTMDLMYLQYLPCVGR